MRIFILCIDNNVDFIKIDKFIKFYFMDYFKCRVEYTIECTLYCIEK